MVTEGIARAKLSSAMSGACRHARNGKECDGINVGLRFMWHLKALNDICGHEAKW